MTAPTYPLLLKDPQAVLDYQVDWSAWLATGETIVTSTWTVPAPLIQASSSHTGTSATVWVTGDDTALGKTVGVTNEITTNQGRTDDRTIRLRVVNR